MSLEQRFIAAYQAYSPDASDSPDAIPYYRTWAGMRAAFGPAFVDTYNGACHNAMVFTSVNGAQGMKAAESAFVQVMANLQRFAQEAKTPDAPRERYSWASKPSEPTESDAKAEFNRQFKIAFPAERLNSKHAKAEWSRVAPKAMDLVQKRYQQEHAAWQAEQDRIESQTQDARQKWLDGLHASALFENAVLDLLQQRSATAKPTNGHRPI